MKKLIGIIAALALFTTANAQPDVIPWGAKTAATTLSNPPVVIYGGNLVGFTVTGFYPADGFCSGGKCTHVVLVQIEGTNFAERNQLTKAITPAGVCPDILKRADDAEAFLKAFLTDGKKYDVKISGWKGVFRNPGGPVIMGDILVDGKSVKELLIEKEYNSTIEELNKKCN